MTFDNKVKRRLLMEYGAVLVARGGPVVPETVVFKDEAEVSAFQSTLPIASENIGGHNIEFKRPR